MLIEHAQEKRLAKSCDLIVANDVGAGANVFGGDSNKVTLVTADGTESLAKPQQSRGGVEARRKARQKAQRGARMSAPLAIGVKVLENGAGLPLPAYQSAGAAGLDLYRRRGARDAGDSCRQAAGVSIPTGVALVIPPGHEGQIRPRSGLAAKAGVTVLNAPGTIDSDYRGEIGVVLINHGAAPFDVVEARASRRSSLRALFGRSCSRTTTSMQPNAAPTGLDQRAA